MPAMSFVARDISEVATTATTYGKSHCHIHHLHLVVRVLVNTSGASPCASPLFTPAKGVISNDGLCAAVIVKSRPPVSGWVVDGRLLGEVVVGEYRFRQSQPALNALCVGVHDRLSPGDALHG